MSGAPYLLTTTYTFAYSAESTNHFNPVYGRYTTPLQNSISTNGWNSIGNTYNFDQDWHLIEQDTNISPAGSSTRLYVTTVPRGSYSWDNNSAMYIFVL